MIQAIILCNLEKNKWTKPEKMAKNLISGPILARLVQIWAPKIIFQGFHIYYMLNTVASYHCMQFQGKRWSNLNKMTKNLILGLI